MRWKLDLLLWPRDQETKFPGEACWFYQTQEGQTEQIHPQTFDVTFFGSTGMIYMHWVSHIAISWLLYKTLRSKKIIP